MYFVKRKSIFLLIEMIINCTRSIQTVNEGRGEESDNDPLMYAAGVRTVIPTPSVWPARPQLTSRRARRPARSEAPFNASFSVP